MKLKLTCDVSNLINNGGASATVATIGAAVAAARIVGTEPLGESAARVLLVCGPWILKLNGNQIIKTMIETIKVERLLS